MNIITKSAQIIVYSSGGNPLIAVFLVWLFWVMINSLMAAVERKIYGERFEHVGDAFVIAFFMLYSAYVVYVCAVFNQIK